MVTAHIQHHFFQAAYPDVDRVPLRLLPVPRSTKDSGMPCDRSQQLTGRLPGAPTAPERPLETGPGFDSRQRCIIGGLERLIAMRGAPGGRDLTAEMDRLLDRMMEQVADEDRFLVLVGFPLAREHVLRHRVLLIDTARLRYRLSRGALLPGELEVLRLRWLEHTQEHDRRFTEFLEGRA